MAEYGDDCFVCARRRRLVDRRRRALALFCDADGAGQYNRATAAREEVVTRFRIERGDPSSLDRQDRERWDAMWAAIYADTDFQRHQATMTFWFNKMRQVDLISANTIKRLARIEALGAKVLAVPLAGDALYVQ